MTIRTGSDKGIPGRDEPPLTQTIHNEKIATINRIYLHPKCDLLDLNNFQGARTVEQAARAPLRLALIDANAPTGTCSNEDGLLPW